MYVLYIISKLNRNGIPYIYTNCYKHLIFTGDPCYYDTQILDGSCYMVSTSESASWTSAWRACADAGGRLPVTDGEFSMQALCNVGIHVMLIVLQSNVVYSTSV